MALETSLYGHSTFSQADLEDEWRRLELERDVGVVRDGDRVVGYALVRERGEELARRGLRPSRRASGAGSGR